MKARDVMTTAVVTARSDMPIREIAALMAEKRISGLPVVTADGVVVGIVSESDLLRRVELGTEKRYKWWLRIVTGTDQLARDFTKAHGQKVADVMSRHVVSVGVDEDLAEVAEVLDQNKVKRVPVLAAGKIVGLITRGDLVRALAGAPLQARSTTPRTAELHQRIIERMREETWASSAMTNVIVKDGVVELWGFVPTPDQKRALRVLVEEIDGVVRVDDNLAVTPHGISGI